MATITFDQVGLSTGITDRARTDGLDTGAQVTITVSPTGGVIEFIDVPIGDTTSVSSLTGGPSTWTFNPTASVYGTWLVQYTPVSGSAARRIFSVRTPDHGLRIPAFNERASKQAKVSNGSSYIADSDDNEGATYRGWTPFLKELCDAIESDAPNAHANSHQHGGSDQISTAVPAANAIPKANASGKLAVGWTSLVQGSVSGPASHNPAVNSLVFCNVSSGGLTVNLPASHAIGDQILIKLVTAATNSVIIDPNGSQTVDGAATLPLLVDYEWALLISNGSNWFRIS